MVGAKIFEVLAPYGGERRIAKNTFDGIDVLGFEEAHVIDFLNTHTVMCYRFDDERVAWLDESFFEYAKIKANTSASREQFREFREFHAYPQFETGHAGLGDLQ